MHICTECGRVHEDDMDFCPHCGSTKGGNVDPALIPPQFRIVNGPQGAYVAKVNMKVIYIALALALIPGVLDIFGLGHFVLKRYVSGLAFLSCTAIVYYERFTGYFGVSETIMFVATLAVLVLQMWDIFRIIKREGGVF